MASFHEMNKLKIFNQNENIGVQFYIYPLTLQINISFSNKHSWTACSMHNFWNNRNVIVWISNTIVTIFRYLAIRLWLMKACNYNLMARHIHSRADSILIASATFRLIKFYFLKWSKLLYFSCHFFILFRLFIVFFFFLRINNKMQQNTVTESFSSLIITIFF